MPSSWRRDIACWETGEVYHGSGDWARRTGGSPNSVLKAASSGRFALGRHYYYADSRRPRPCELEWSGNGVGMPVVEETNRLLFANGNSAARRFGISYQTVYRHLYSKRPTEGGLRFHWASMNEFDELFAAGRFVPSSESLKSNLRPCNDKKPLTTPEDSKNGSNAK